MKQWLLIAVTLIMSFSAQSAERIITLGGDVTEIVFELDAGAQVVARR
ncbi:Hemin-binding periplasmic protein hmuT precursor [Providencia stuartii]|nr:Hemin-binding periplasmic protein hmuT precursor [Providencia stuartii]